MSISSKPVTLKQTLPFILIIGGLIGMLCAGILTVEKFDLLKHPGTHLNCDLNPIVACGPVINTKQASAFGFPNPLVGLVGFAGVATIGGALLAGAAFKRWFWRWFQAGVLFGVGFVTWLQFETIYRIHALCPFCMVVWSVMIPIFIYTTLYNLRAEHVPTPKPLKRLVEFAQRHHGDILVLWYLLILTTITTHFWYYWRTLF